MAIEKITIKKLGRKQMPSKFKPGETYSMTTVMDEKGRKITANGAWADNWVEGDVVEGDITEKVWKDRDGFDQKSLTITNPNAKKFTPGKSFGPNPTLVSWQIAGQIAPLIFAGKEAVTLDLIEKLANKIKSKIDIAAVPEKNDNVPTVDVNKEETKAAPAKKVAALDDLEEEEGDDDTF